jgi:trehalose 6-phosphate phosphatase
LKELFSHWPEISGRVQKSSRRLYLFDIDGTLAPIAKTPGEARIGEDVRKFLAALSAQRSCRVGIITGRKLDDARQLIGLPGLSYAGNHGLEIFFGGRRVVHPAAKAKRGAIAQIHALIKKTFERIPGVIVEGKSFSISVHYRLVAARLKPRFERLIEQEILPRVTSAGLFARHGKKVVEILPSVEWNKGSALAWIAKRWRRPLTLFVGDDVTDESAFGAMRPTDVSVRVGHAPDSLASYYLKTQRDTKKLLRHLLDLERSISSG